MRIKSLPPHSKQTYTLNYLFQKAELNDKCELLYSNNNNGSLESWITLTKDNCDKRQLETGYELDWNKNTIHFVLSVHPDDADVMDNNWKSVLLDTYEKFSIDPYENNSIAWLHKDKNHHHIHLVFSKIDSSANRWDDSNIGYRLNEFSNEIDQKYGLTITIGDNTDVNKNEPIKHDLNKRLAQLYSKSYDFNDFMAYSSEYNISITKVKNSDKQPYFIFTDLNTGYEFPSTSFSKRYSYNSLIKLDKANPKKDYVPELNQKNYLKNSIKSSLYKSTNLNQLKNNLENYGVKIIEHSNSSGVFGLSFTQESVKNPVIFKGSELDYTYKKIVYLLNLNLERETDLSKSIEKDSESKDIIDQVKRKTYFPGMPNSQSDDTEQEQRKKKKKRRRNI